MQTRKYINNIKMNDIKIYKKIIKQSGSCVSIWCSKCPWYNPGGGNCHFTKNHDNSNIIPYRDFKIQECKRALKIVKILKILE